MSNNDVPLLTAKECRNYLDCVQRSLVETAHMNHALEAIATGRAVVIPRRTEAEWRAEFESTMRKRFGWTDHAFQRCITYSSDQVQSDWAIWIDAISHVGAIRPDEKEGV